MAATPPPVDDSCWLSSAFRPFSLQGSRCYPRYLASVGRAKEAGEVLEHIRRSSDGHVEQEFFEIRAAPENTKPTSPIEFVKVLLDLDNSLAPHLGRRAWLCLWLQIMTS